MAKNKNTRAEKPQPISESGRGMIRIPKSLLTPIGNLLAEQIHRLEFRKKSLSETDPFRSNDRINDNAAIDTDASEQSHHARVSAIQRQLDRQIIQLRKALARVKIGTYGLCENCGKLIDTDRLMIYPEATLCVDCEQKREK